MPISKGIVVLLESQFDAETIPEEVLASDGDEHSINNNSSIIDINIPNYLASQFWISYSVEPSMITQHLHQTKFVYFKLIVDGECIVSWGVGESDEWKGKTMWAFFHNEDEGTGWRTVEKRGFFFRTTDEEQRFEVLVYRAKGRRRASRQFGRVPPLGEKGIDLVNWGRLKEHHPQRFYQYALIDAVDEPYATFRYHVRPDDVELLDRASRSSLMYSTSSESSSGSSAEGYDGSQIRRLSYPPTIRLVPTSTSTDSVSPIKINVESASTTTADLDFSNTNHTISEPQAETATLSVQYDSSCNDTTVPRKSATRTPSPFVPSDPGSAETPPSSLRKRGVEGLKSLFGKRKSGKREDGERPVSVASVASIASSSKSSKSW